MRQTKCPIRLARQSIARKVLQQLSPPCLFLRRVCLRARRAVLQRALLCDKQWANISSDRAVNTERKRIGVFP